MIHDTETCDCEMCRWSDKRERDEFGRKLVPCELCGKPTAMTGTKRCDRCWELETRIRMDMELAKKIIVRLEAKRVAA